jgi:hypothetical protein
MTDGVALVLALSIGVALVERGRLQLYALLTAVVTGTAVALSLTRAEYFGLAGGVVVGLIVISATGPRGVKARIGWRVVGTVTVALVAVTLVVVTAPQVGQSGAVHDIANRVSTGVAGLTGGSTSTLSYRTSLDQTMLGILGNKWPVGLGFLPPSFAYFPQLPQGSIVNSDVGVVNGLMVIGAIGTVLLYLPLMVFVGWIVRGLARAGPDLGLRLGLAIWGITTLAASITLYTLFSTGGLVIVAAVIGISISVLSARESSAVARPPCVHSSRT